MRAFVYAGADVIEISSPEELAAQVAGRPFWWLDVSEPTGAEPLLEAVVGDRAAAAWLTDFGHPPSFHWTNAGLQVVVPVYVDAATAEVHALLLADGMISCHAEAGTVFREMRSRAGGDHEPPSGSAAFVLLLEDLLDTFRPVLAGLRAEVDDLSESALLRPSSDQLRRMASVRRRVHAVRTALVSYADAADDLVNRLSLLPRMSASDRLVLQSHAAHAATLARRVEELSDACSHAMEVHVSMVTTRQGQVINWLTAVSIVFLPLTFITGFFGMNFDWMVDRVSGAAHFWLLGVGLQLVIVVLLVIAGRRLIPVLRGDLEPQPTREAAKRSGSVPAWPSAR